MPGSTESITSQWLVSVRGGGEVLTAEVTENETRLLVLTTIPGRTRRELEGRLHDILETATARTIADLGPRPIPGLVHHSIEAVIAWRAELLRTFPECELCALLFHQSQRDVAFGFVGGLAPVVIIDGDPWPGPWIPYSSRPPVNPAARAQHPRNRRALGAGEPAAPESQAFSMYAGRRLRLDLTWSADLRAHGGSQISIDVGWLGLGQDARALDHEGPSLQAAPELEGAEFDAVEFAEAVVTEGGESVGAPESGVEIQAVEPPSAVASARESIADMTRANPFFQWLDAIATQGANPGGRPASLTPAAAPPAREPATGARSGAAKNDTDENASAIPRLPDHLSGITPPTPSVPFQAPPAAIDSVPESSQAQVEDPASHETHDAGMAQEPAPVASAEPEPVEQDSIVAVADHPETAIDADPVASSIGDPALRHEDTFLVPRGEDVNPVDEPVASPRASSGTAIRQPRRLVVPASASASAEAWPAFAKRAWPWAAVIAVLFAAGWYVGRMPTERNPATGPSPIVRALRAVGLGGRWFELDVTSVPDGAWITVDGREVQRQTPARLELTPGNHTVTLSIPNHGHVDYTVNGVHRSRIPLAGVLLGTLVVTTPNSAIPIAVAVDGTPHGYAPLRLERLAPGPHEVAFSGPGMDPWAQTVDIEPNHESGIIARPFESPATGVVDVRARLIDEEGQELLKGAQVWVDGERMGVTPLTLELPRGPHSVRVAYRDERAPVQVIDLPGGNQRFADFDFGTGAFRPTLTLTTSAGPMSLEKTNLVSVTLQGVVQGEVREMWLHVRTPGRTWKRFPMTTLQEAGGIVGVVPFPAVLLDDRGRATFYVSALTTLGDEYFTELQNAEKPVKKKPAAIE